MSEVDRIIQITDRAGTGAPNFTFGVNFAGSDSGINPFTHTEGSTEPSSPNNGDTWWDTDNDLYKVYMDNAWKDWLGTSAATGIAWGGDRSVTHCGYADDNSTDTLEYHSIGTAGNATDFGNVTEGRYMTSAVSNGTRGVYIGGQSTTGGGDLNIIDYITFATTGNATDFGDTLTGIERTASCSDGTRGVIGGGSVSGYVNTIQYITIASAGNATDFGDLTKIMGWGSAMADATRGIINEGQSISATASMEYVTIQTTGNATDFGDHANNRQSGAASDATRGLVVGGDSGSRLNTISYVTIQTTGNTADFGDLTVAGSRIGCAGDGTYITSVGGRDRSNTIDRVTVQTTGNAIDHGDMAVAGQYNASAAGAAS